MTFKDYIIATKERKPSPLLVEALELVKTPGAALDLGAGALHDARYLLSKGFKVTAVDSESTFIEQGADLPAQLVVSTFADFDFPTNHFAVVNAQYALPFNPPESFPQVFASLTVSLMRGGIFTGQLFGVEDDWTERSTMNFHTEAGIRTLLAPYTIHKLTEIKRVGPTQLGGDKFWHYFDIIAEKR